IISAATLYPTGVHRPGHGGPKHHFDRPAPHSAPNHFNRPARRDGHYSHGPSPSSRPVHFQGGSSHHHRK
ncbi:MAG: hypothetical protein IJJ26_13750, partial [Victivallales bacterium]|nr:hypothetical protein [Victivallales bacterium]